MSTQTSHFLRLPVELRLIIFEYIFSDPKEAVLRHSLTYVSDQVSEEVMPVLLRRFSAFFWTAISCDEEWYLAIKPRDKIWRMRLTNVSEWPLSTVPTLHTTFSFHVLVGRRISTSDDLIDRLDKGYVAYACDHRLEDDDQQDGVKRLIKDIADNCHEYGGLDIWIERGRAGAPEMNMKLTKQVWRQEWIGGGRRGPLMAQMCKLNLDVSKTGRQS
ncbi:hypothetical protein M436DRAFT_78735 [Aureobasidium namibiae CBS 147.97]|uniref:F-box domain-containing protein n=1 Tax=Aureobasidium namibiae CBS 147.97 TaxID=1043004 RepID=A0A074X4P5_9PEZI